MKNIRIFIRKLSVFGGEIFNIFEQACLRNVNSFMPNGLFDLYSLDRSISSIRGIWLLSPCFIEIPVFNANRVDPDQTSR